MKEYERRNREVAVGMLRIEPGGTRPKGCESSREGRDRKVASLLRGDHGTAAG